MSLQKSINSILDTPKVEALLIFDLDGSVYFEKVPESTNSSALEKLPQRILMMYDIIADNFQNCSDFILKFEKKNLYFRKSSDKKGKDFILAILGDAGINFVSLKLVTNLAMKMIELENQPASEEVTTTEKKNPRSKLTYRGQQVNTEKPVPQKSKKTRSGLTYRGQKL
jgi:hypothetical protein